MKKLNGSLDSALKVTRVVLKILFLCWLAATIAITEVIVPTYILGRMNSIVFVL